MLRIEARSHDNVTILTLSGLLTSGIGCQSLAQHVKHLATAGLPRVLVQLNDVSLIDSAGVGELISSFTCVKKSGGVLKVCGANDRVGEVLRIVRLPAIIDVYAGEAEALASFA
jgi:anti-anti-sigma factor